MAEHHQEQQEKQNQPDPRHKQEKHDKQDENFRVVDRRLFDAQGQLRKDALEEEQRRERLEHQAPSAGKKNVPSPPAQSKPGIKAASAGTETAPVLSPPAAPAVPSSHAFQMLVDLLARNAAAMLGGMQDPRTGQAFLDLEGAREVIDMIDVLREKTRGNLSPEDDALLIEMLGSLKLSYMEISKAAAEAMREKAKAKT